jgi:hypothetical protein
MITMVGKNIISSKFKLVKLLGSGSFAKILLIEDQYRPGDLYAAKIVIGNDEDVVAKLK